MESPLDNLPDLPQIETLKRVVERLKLREDVRLVWLGGSFATGKADRYSDVDLRIAVNPEALCNWLTLDLQDIFDDSCPGCITMQDPGKSVLHHVLLSNGELFDVYVQPFPPMVVEDVVVLIAKADGCEFPENVKAENPGPQPTTGGEIEQFLRSYWVNSHKHRKVITRNLDLMAQIGLRFDQDALRRLWYLNLTGCDEKRSQTIHTLTDQIRVITKGIGPQAFEVLGMPLKTRVELVAAIEATRSEVSKVGRQLALKYGFNYPEDLELVVTRCWEESLPTIFDGSWQERDGVPATLQSSTL